MNFMDYNPINSTIFSLTSSLSAPLMKRFIAGRATTEAPRPGQERNRFVVRFTDLLEPISVERMTHSSHCSFCRCPWTTLQFRTAFALDHTWSGLVAEFLKFLASTSIQCKLCLTGL